MLSVAHHLWPLQVPRPQDCPANLPTSSYVLEGVILTELQALLKGSQSPKTELQLHESTSKHNGNWRMPNGKK